MAAALIVPVILLFLWILEFAEEGPSGNGYVLTPDARFCVATVGIILMTCWLFAVVNLYNGWQQKRKNQRPERL